MIKIFFVNLVKITSAESPKNFFYTGDKNHLFLFSAPTVGPSKQRDLYTLYFWHWNSCQQLLIMHLK